MCSLFDMTKDFECYLIGGAVRDRLLRRTIGDRDWVVVGSSQSQMKALGYLPVGKNFPVYLHPETKEEYALARKELKVGLGHSGFEVDDSSTITLEEDLFRRDLTINAIAEDVHGQLIDPFNGLADIEKKVLRHVSEAFVEDPLRVFRVARLAAELPDFSVAEETRELMSVVSQKGELTQLSAERVWLEMVRALGAFRPETFFDVLDSCFGLTDWFPELIGRDIAFTDGDSIDRYCELNLSRDSFDALGKRLKSPKSYLIASRYWSSYNKLIKQWRSASQEDLYDCLEKMKVFHETKHVDRLLNLASRHGSYEFEMLRSIVVDLCSLELGLDREALTSREIGSVIKEKRIEWLKEQYRN